MKKNKYGHSHLLSLLLFLFFIDVIICMSVWKRTIEIKFIIIIIIITHDMTTLTTTCHHIQH